jgi:hypothetical protein
MRRMESITQPAPYLPFDSGPYRPTMGLQALAPEAWIEITDGLASELARKRALLETRHDEVFAALTEAGPAAAELLAVLVAHLTRHHPALYERHGDRLASRLTGESWDIVQPPMHPLDLAGRLVPEDFCILLSDAGVHRLVAASLCSPSRWRLAEKLGRPMSVIHESVPLYAERLGAPVDRFLTALQPDKLVWRLNWFVHDDPTLFQPARRPSTVPITPANAGERLYLRVERQTLRRLPRTGAIVFSIRTHVTPLAAAIGTARAASDLAATLRSMSEPVRAYRQFGDFEASLLDWLEERAKI